MVWGNWEVLARVLVLFPHCGYQEQATGGLVAETEAVKAVRLGREKEDGFLSTF